MGLSLRCFLLLSLLTLTAGTDFLLDLDKASGQTLFRDSNRAKRSAVASLRHRVRKRSAPPDASCDALKGYEAKLVNNTHNHTFIDLSGEVSLAWVGDGTGVILALTTFQVPFFLVKLGQSKLYRSEDYGKTFDDVTNLINNTFIRSEFGIATGPENSGKVILTGEVSGGHRLSSRIFVSSDFGRSFNHLDLPFNPISVITYNPENSNVLLGLSNIKDLWLTKDFGQNWKKIHTMVCMAKWGTKNAIFFSTNHNGSCSARGELEMWRTTDFGETFKRIVPKIYSFGLGGRFLFASVMTGEATERMLHVSVDHGDHWNMAQLSAIGPHQFYSILGASNEMVFMHVDGPKDDGIGTIYVSDDRGTVFSKSLERHLYTTTGGDTDFTNITSLRGVFTTSVMGEDKSVKTVVTRDMGGEWSPLRKPANSKCQLLDQEECSFHIHASYSTAMKLNVPMLPLSEPNAVGLILAHGSVGNAISVMRPDVFVSDDGGYTWMKALDGPHHYAILDSGGLLVAVEHSPEKPIDKIKFSTDEGQCWHSYTFTDDPIFFTGLASEPGARSMNVSIWGYKNSMISQHWISTTIDFRDLLTRDCEDDDYVQWLSHSDNVSDPNNGCILGYKETFRRLRKDSVCYNGRSYLVSKQPTPCPCSLDDFLCDFGFYRKENSSECVEQPDLIGKVLEYCLHGQEEQLLTQGYRKIPGDKCEGGTIPERKEIDLSERCVSDLLGPDLQKEGHATKSVAIVLTIIIMLLSVGAGVIFIKKYVCGGRFLVHRYSVLQQHANENAAEVMDDPLDEQLESNHSGNGKIDFHDDSDEDLLQ
ncbi:sortilin-like [Festucalex cinctus]